MWKYIDVPYFGHFDDPVSHFCSVTSKYLHTVSTTGKKLRRVCIMTLLKMLLSNSHRALVDLQPVFADDKHRMYITKTDICAF